MMRHTDMEQSSAVTERGREAAGHAYRVAGRMAATAATVAAKASSKAIKAAAAGCSSLTAAGRRRGDRDREDIIFAHFTSAAGQQLLALGYGSGWQLWSLSDPDSPKELVSRRDGPVRLIASLPAPRTPDLPGHPLHGCRPILALVPTVAPAGPSDLHFPQRHTVQFYSLASNGVVASIPFASEVLAVQGSSRLVAVALRGQLNAYDARTLQPTFTCMTNPLPASPPAPPRGGTQLPGADAVPSAEAAPLAVGERWVAYPTDQPIAGASSHAVAQRLPPSPFGRSLSTLSSSSSGGTLWETPSRRPADLQSVTLHYAQRSGEQIVAGVSAAGAGAYRILSRRYQSWKEAGSGGSSNGLGNGGLRRTTSGYAEGCLAAGVVMVRDVLDRRVVAHFQAHSAPLAALQFDPTGCLLATASVQGTSVNVFRITPPTAAAAGAAPTVAGEAVHLWQLRRGVTPAFIQEVTFSPCTAWVAVGTGKGTTHLFAVPVDMAGRVGAGLALPRPRNNQSRSRGVAAPLQPVLFAPVGRARRRGVLGSTPFVQAAVSAVQSFQPQGASAVAAAFLPATGAGDRGRAACELAVVAADGVLTRHALQAAPPEKSDGGSPSAAAPVASYAAHSGTSAAGGGGGAPAMNEVGQWDVCRQRSWDETEEPLLVGTAPEGLGSSGGASGGISGSARDVEAVAWVAAAEATTHAPLSSLWDLPQFRLVASPPLAHPPNSRRSASPVDYPAVAWTAQQPLPNGFTFGGSVPRPGSTGSSAGSLAYPLSF